MLKAIDNFYLQQPEPTQSCLLALRKIIVEQNPAITEEWKYQMPFFCYKGKLLCYLWIHKKHKQPYIGIVKGSQLSHPELLLEKRAKMKILLVNPTTDLPIDILQNVVQQAIQLYK